MKEAVYVAVDVGATGIKMAAASFRDGKLKIRDIYSAGNPPYVENGHEKADIAHMLQTIREGLDRFSENYRCVSVGIDTYGNGYGILDENGELIQLPHHYRDRRIDGVM